MHLLILSAYDHDKRSPKNELSFFRCIFLLFFAVESTIINVMLPACGFLSTRLCGIHIHIHNVIE